MPFYNYKLHYQLLKTKTNKTITNKMSIPVYKVPVVKMDLKSCTSRLINLFDSKKMEL